MKELLRSIRQGTASLDEAYDIRDDPFARFARTVDELQRLQMEGRAICRVADGFRTFINISLIALLILAGIALVWSWTGVAVSVFIVVGFQALALMVLRILTVRMLRLTGNDTIVGLG